MSTSPNVAVEIQAPRRDHDSRRPPQEPRRQDRQTHTADVDRRKPLIPTPQTTTKPSLKSPRRSRSWDSPTPNFPAVEPEAFLSDPFLERVKILALNWVDNGYGVPRMVHVIYIVKLVLFYALGGIVVATLPPACRRSGMFRSGGTSRSSTRR